ncbi:MAG: DJ-1/PfpI family protein [Candidatus Micrarchaeaceae archaeon]
MAKVSIIVAPYDFKDETLRQALLLFGKKGIRHEILSLASGECKGYHGHTVKQDGRADEFEPVYSDAILLVDGPGIESTRLYENRQLLDRLKAARDNKKVIAAVGNAIKAIAKANIIKGIKIANSEDAETKRLVGLYKGSLAEDQLVVDSGIISASDGSQMQALVDAVAEAIGVS